MAVDKLVDSTQLDNDLTTIANAIRTKGGTSASLSFPNGMAQAISDLPSEGMYQYLGNIGLSKYLKHEYPSSLTFDLTNVDRLSYFIMSDGWSGGYSSCNDVYFTNIREGINLSNMCGGENCIRNYHFVGGVKPNNVSTMSSRTGSYNPARVYGEMDLSGLTSNPFRSFEACDYIELKQNSLSRNISEPYMNTGTVDQVVIQIANSLNESVTGKSASFNSYARNRINAILGNVSMDSTNTYHIFTEDSSGTTTLQDFIVNTKGWTVA